MLWSQLAVARKEVDRLRSELQHATIKSLHRRVMWKSVEGDLLSARKEIKRYSLWLREARTERDEFLRVIRNAARCASDMRLMSYAPFRALRDVVERDVVKRYGVERYGEQDPSRSTE